MPAHQVKHYLTPDGRDPFLEWRSSILDRKAGPGYRVYYAMAGRTIVLLLGGGTKRAQETDIAKACNYWKAWKDERPTS